MSLIGHPEPLPPRAQAPTICCVIPTYNERDYLGNTLVSLRNQSLAHTIEVVIADYDPDGKGAVKEVVELYRNSGYTLVKYLPVSRKGIAFARHLGILSSLCPYIVNLDADVKFEQNDAIERLVVPLWKREAAVTCCNYEMEKSDVQISPIANSVYQAAVIMQRHSPLVILEPGMSFTRFVYNEVGGFSDLKQYEGMELSARIVAKYLGMKRYIPEVKIIASPRRLEGFTKYGLIAADYDVPVR